MAYNIPDSYKNQTPVRLDKAALTKNGMAFRFSYNLLFNYERNASGWLVIRYFTRVKKKIIQTKNDLAASMSHNLEILQYHPFLVTFVMGLYYLKTKNKADIPTIRAVRVAAMGPLSGIGDAFWFQVAVPIVASSS